ncbi:MAG: A/G-specific adenine glycosylase [Alphaproteobacteria bacterium]|nr:A/G-specific adenine glycosylase [Alphaproteobacteria bacterium]
MSKQTDVPALRTALLAWYDRSRRRLPWRALPGERADPYRVWLSEIMLQQTTVAAAGPYFERFTARWPDAAALAAAPREEVLAAWAGLGYYARARNLHAAAQTLALHGPPADETGWRALPGVGAYTAAAIAAIALDQPATVVDGNVERVMARFFAVAAPLPGAKRELHALAARFLSAERPGDFAQAMMDLGATVCTPKSPACAICPWTAACAARANGDPDAYPRRAAKAAKPERHGVAFRLERGDAIFLVRRPEKGLLGGMAALPSTPWEPDRWTRAAALAHAPAAAPWREIGAVRHVFTHFALTLEVWAGQGAAPSIAGEWSTDASALPSVFRKAAALD